MYGEIFVQLHLYENFSRRHFISSKFLVRFIRKEQGSKEEFGRDCCICDYHVYGYHVYKKIWQEAIGEELKCDREPENSCDRYAVCVKRTVVIIGHLLRKLSSLFAVFLRHGGVISCTVTGGCRYSGDLHSGKVNLSDQADRPWV